MSFFETAGNVAQNIGSGLVNVWNRIAHPQVSEQRQLANSMKSAEHQFGLDSAFQSQANDFTAAQTEEWNLWQAEREDTAIQRKVADMKKSGINPIMMYGNVDGASSSSPSVASASGATSRGSNYQARNDDVLSSVISVLAKIVGGLV